MPLHSATGSSLCAIQIPPMRVCAFLSNRRSNRMLLGQHSLMRTLPPWLDGTRLGCPAQWHDASLRYTNSQSAPCTYELNQSQAFSDSVRLRRAHTFTRLSPLGPLPRASQHAPDRLWKRYRKGCDVGSAAKWLLRPWHRVDGEVRR